MQTLTLKLRNQWRDASVRDAVLILLFAALFYSSKLAGKSVEHLPGHSGAFWIPPLILSAGLVRRSGAATLTALLGALLWCGPRGDGAGSLAPYLIAGLVLDLVNGSEVRLRSLPVALAAGAAAHAAKFAFTNLPRTILGVPSDFLAWGLGTVAALHVAFGLLGGLVGWLLLGAVTRRRGSPPA